MGLDWMLQRHKARLGFEDRYVAVTAMLNQMKGHAESPELERELEEISLSCYEVVGAPQVGEDPAANEWFRFNCYVPAIESMEGGALDPEQEAFWRKPFEELLELHRGKYVMELAQDTGGLAKVQGIAAGVMDFRGKVLCSISGLDKTLVDEGFQDHTWEECLDYANRLEAELPKVPEGSRERELLEAAIEWLRFWGSKGFGFWAWY